MNAVDSLGGKTNHYQYSRTIIMTLQDTISTHLVRFVLAAGVSALILAILIILVSSGHSPAERPHILELLSNTVGSGILLFLLLHLTGVVIRAIRYRILLQAAGETRVPGFWHMLLVTGFRNMVVDMLPSRLGELGYVALLNRVYKVSAASCLSSLAIAMIFDFIALAIIVLLAIIGYLIGSGVQGWLWGALIVAITAAAVGAGTLTTLLPWTAKWMQSIKLRGRPRKLFTNLTELVTQLDNAIKTTRSSGTLGKVLILSLLVRSLKYGSIFLLFMAVAKPSLPAIAEIAHVSIFSAIVGAEIGASLPIPTFMSFGTYEAGGTLVFSLLGISEQQGLLALLGVHIWSQIVDYSLGGCCLVLVILLGRRGNRQIAEPGESNRPVWALGVAAVILIVGGLSLAWQYRANQKLGAISAPSAGKDLRTVESGPASDSIKALRQAGVTGFVIWSSNRFGNHDILRMELPGGQISKVTDHPHTETLPRISPDGNRIVFSRSQQPWVSQRNTIAWDVILLDLESGKEQRLAESATYPFWINSESVGYLHHGVQVTQHDLSKGETKLVYRSGENNSMPAGAPITSPELNPRTGELVFTAKQSAIGMNTGFWGTALWQNNGQGAGQIRGVLDGCELNWSSDGRWLYQVGHGGRQETMFYRIDPVSLEARPWLDLAGEFSHEYWPKDSNDGRFLVFGASRGEHEHDVADYELFLWPIDSGIENVIRLTFHSGNDNWPDVFIK